MMKNRLHSIIRKCRNEYGFWGGYLQPMEVIKLYESGFVSFDKFQKKKIDYAIENKKKGICNPTWVYFQPKNEFLEIYRGLKR